MSVMCRPEEASFLGRRCSATQPCGRDRGPIARSIPTWQCTRSNAASASTPIQEEYFLGQLGIEDCIRESAEFGALGIEIIPEQMMRGYPHITDDFYRQWHGWMDKYGTTPVASDLFIDTKKFPDRWLTVDEQVESVHRDLEIAHRLGVTEIRAIINTPPEVMEGAAPRAEELGLRLLLEVHAPFHYEHPWILRHLEVMHRLQSPALGFMPDMGTYVERFPRVVTDHARRQGGREDLLDLIVATYDAHGDVHGLMDTVYYMGGGPIETGMARQATHYTWNDPRNMLRLHALHPPHPGQVLRDDRRGRRVLHPLRQDHPGAHRGWLLRLPVQ